MPSSLDTSPWQLVKHTCTYTQCQKPPVCIKLHGVVYFDNPFPLCAKFYRGSSWRSSAPLCGICGTPSCTLSCPLQTSIVVVLQVVVLEQSVNHGKTTFWCTIPLWVFKPLSLAKDFSHRSHVVTYMSMCKTLPQHSPTGATKFLWMKFGRCNLIMLHTSKQQHTQYTHYMNTTQH